MSFISKLKKCSLAKRLVLHFDPFPVDAWTDLGYQKWYENNRVNANELEKQRAHSFENSTSFSLIVPLYQTPENFLRDMVESVLSQTYPRFELLLVNASPEDSVLKSAVRKFCESDSRIKEVVLDENYGITENTNFGIDHATGEFICFLDHDDFLEPNALFEFAKVINSDHKTDILYCDEDMVEFVNGKRRHVHPLFKPAYSPELLLCKNYVVHLLTIRRSIVERVSRPTRIFDGSQDYNMLLSATEQARAVHHVPKVLYHWRISVNSTATNPESKPYTRRSNRLAIQGHLERTAEQASLFFSGIPNLHNLWFKQTEGLLVSVVVLQTGPDEQLNTCLESFAQSNSYEHYELIVVSDHKPALSVFCESLPVRHKEVPEDCPMEHSAWFNFGAEAARGEYLLFWDDTLTFATPEPLEQLLGLCIRDAVGAVSPKILYVGGEVRYYGIATTSQRLIPLYRGYPDDFPAYQCNTRCFQNVSAVSYEGMMTQRKAFELVGGFNASYRSVVGAVDFCKRLTTSGYRIVQTPTVKAESAERCPTDRYNNASNSPEFDPRDVALFYETWPDVLAAGDPFFNANFDQFSCYTQIPKVG